ncbi:uncharacterized protein [Argopecten irradians]|uniref:uncharacterized protein n=1 Tax=Argopecten irradians TaxID=31199 RepID=UPI003712130D
MDKSSRWFKCQPVGVNKLGRFMTTMAENAGLTSKTGGNGKRLTNHSARKYLVQKLNDNGLPPNQIMQISGHKNIQSINNYSTINSNQHRDDLKNIVERALRADRSASKQSIIRPPAIITSVIKR